MYDKLKEIVLNTYLDSNNINKKRIDKKISQISFDTNAILNMLLKTPYFEEKFKYVQMVSNGDGYFYNIDISHDSSNIIYYKTHSEEQALHILKSEKVVVRNNMKLGIKEADIDTIDLSVPLDQLKTIHDTLGSFNSQFEKGYYEDRIPVLIESNERIERTLDSLKNSSIAFLLDQENNKKILDEKYSFSFEHFKIDKNDILGFFKIKDKINSLLAFSNTQKELNQLFIDDYQLKYFGNMKDTQYDLIICHNHRDICGVATLSDASLFNDIAPGVASYLNCVEVTREYRGHKIGLQLAKEAIDHHEKEEKMILRTNSSQDGSLFIKDAISSLAEISRIPVISGEERYLFLELLKINNKELIKNTQSMLQIARKSYKNGNYKDPKIKEDILSSFRLQDNKKSRLNYGT